MSKEFSVVDALKGHLDKERYLVSDTAKEIYNELLSYFLLDSDEGILKGYLAVYAKLDDIDTDDIDSCISKDEKTRLISITTVLHANMNDKDVLKEAINCKLEEINGERDREEEGRGKGGVGIG
jgi:hypothetical protein